MVPHHRFGSRLAIRPRNLPSNSSRLRRGYDRAPRGAVSFCRSLTSARFPSRAALKILPRSRRTRSSQPRQSTRSQASPSNTTFGSSGPFTEVPNLSLTSDIRVRVHFKSPPAHVSTLPGSEHQARYPASWSSTPPEEVPVLRSTGSCCLSAAGIRFLGTLSRREFRPPYGRPTVPAAHTRAPFTDP